MAIKVLDSVPFAHGFSLANTYWSFRGTYSLRKYAADVYHLTGSYEVRAVNDSIKPPLDGGCTQVVLTEAELTGNMLTRLYTQLKTQFTVTEDC